MPFLTPSCLVLLQRFTTTTKRETIYMGTLPLELTEFKLDTIRLGQNQLYGTIPLSYGRLSLLRILDVSDNQLSSGDTHLIRRVLAGLLRLPLLEEYNVANNHFTDAGMEPVPKINLRVLNISHTPIRFTFDERLFDYDSVICDTIIEHLSAPNLEVLDVTNCSIPGPFFCDQMDRLSSLKVFRFDHNQFTGSLPTELGLLTSLTDLSGSHNQFTGSFPWSTVSYNMDSLTRLDFAHNRLHTVLPTSQELLDPTTHLPSLEYIDLSNNYKHPDDEEDGSVNLNDTATMTTTTSMLLTIPTATTTIPEAIGQLTNLRSLILHSTNLMGTLPSTLGSLLSLQTLDVSKNQLEGSIPSELSNCDDMRTLLLYDNELDGSIPTELSRLVSLGEFEYVILSFAASKPNVLASLIQVLSCLNAW